MRKISFWIFILICTVTLARAQDAATQQQLDKMFGQIQDMQAAQELQSKRLAALEKQISDLSDKINAAPTTESASREDLKALATQVQEIDKKRQDDRDLILKQIKSLGEVSGSAAPSRKSRPAPDTTAAGGDNSTAPAVSQKGYEHVVESGETLSAIAKAYRAQGVKVTTAQIIAANPKLNPNALIAGKKIFIPDANAK